jgi:predicted MFS family arabinose efflux permease
VNLARPIVQKTLNITEHTMFGRLIWLALGALAVGTETFVIAALLPSIASDLRVSLAAAGQAVTVFALAYAIGAPMLSIAAGDVDRRKLLAGCLAVFSIANLMAAGAQNLPHLVLARILLALTAGLYVPTANAVASAMVPSHMRGRAIAVVVGGMTVAVAFGVPLGAWIGAYVSWRMTFVMVAAIGAIAVAGLWFGLPRNLPRGATSLSQRLAVARRPEILHGLAVTLAFATGVFTVFTFLAPLLNRSAGFDAHQVSATLFLFGVAAAAGNALGGAAADRFGPLPTVRAGVAAIAVIFATLSFATTTLSTGYAAVVIVTTIGLWGIVGWGLYSAQMANLVRLAPDVAMVTLSLNSSTFYLGVAVGSMLGSLAISSIGVAALGWIAALAQFVALGVLHWPLHRTSAATPAIEPGE